MAKISIWRVLAYLAVALAAAATGFALWVLPTLEAPAPTPGSGMRNAAVGLPEVAAAHPELLFRATPEAIVESVEALYRLPLDIRLTGALSEVDALLSVKGDARPTARFENGKWTLEHRGIPLGELEEVPDFHELYGGVAKYALAQVDARGDALGITRGDHDCVQEADEDPAAWLRRIDAAWGKGPKTVALVRSAASAHAQLVLQYADKTGVSESVASRAVAVLAFAESLGGAMVRERALLADLFGYGRAAATIAGTLPNDDPVRLLAQGDVAASRDRATRAGATRLERQLAMQAAFRHASRAEQKALFASLPADFRDSLSGYWIQADLDWGTWGEWRLAIVALTELRRSLQMDPKADVMPGENAKLEDFVAAVTALLGNGLYLPLLDGLLDRLRASERGYFFDVHTEAAYYRGYLFTALEGAVRWALKTYGSADQAESIAKAFGDGTSVESKAFRRYVDRRILADRRTLKMRDIVTDLQQLTALGPSAMRNLYDAAPEESLVDAVVLQAAAAMASRCDTRPMCVALARWMAWGPALDLLRAERLGKFLYERYPRADPYGALWYAALAGDRKGFDTALGDPSLQPSLRAEAVRDAEGLLGADAQRAAFERLSEEAPLDSDVAEAFLQWLDEEQKDHRAARAVAQRWLDAKGEKHPLAVIQMKTLAARELQHAGDLEAAWAEVEPLIESWHGTPLYRGALILSDLERHEAAIALARRRLGRYPDAMSLEVLARVLWEAGSYAEAAASLAGATRKPVLSEWTWKIGKQFGEAFADKPVAEAKKAFGELIAAKLDPLGLREIASARYLPPEHAFELSGLIPTHGYMRHRDGCRRYGYLRDWKGEDAARDWIRGQFKGKDAEPLSQFAYEAGLFALEFEVAPDPGPEHPHEAFAWLMRAVSYVRGDLDRPEWKAMLDAHYGKATTHLHDRLGMYLLGLGDAESAWKLAGGADTRTEVLYYMAVKAQLDGDIPEAMRLFRAVVETASFREGEFGWARDQLWKWRDRKMSVARLTAAPAEDDASDE